DGQAEVIFGTWPRNGSRRVGKIVVTDWQGNLLQQIALPAPLSTDASAWNGVLGAPTLANIDADADLELVVGTVSAGIVAYDLPGSAGARVLWGTGRGSFLRTGAQSPPTSFTMNAPAPAQPGDLVDFKLVLSDPIAAPLLTLQLTDSLPNGLSFVPGSLKASSGTASESGGTISWNGALRSGKPITITFQAQISAAISSPTVLINQAQLSGGRTATFRTTLIVNGQGVWLPALRR
ncbi:MAG: isopeptide-forming domain-containing fimbrial protein, partial [Roseiflexaceae bacterium]